MNYITRNYFKRMPCSFCKKSGHNRRTCPEAKKTENRFERTLELHKETKAKADEERRKTNEVQKKAREAQSKAQSREQSRTQSRGGDIISGEDILNNEEHDIFLRNILSPQLCKTNMCRYYDAPCQCWSTTKEKDRNKEIKCLLWEITNERGEKVTCLEKKVIEKRDRMR